MTRLYYILAEKDLSNRCEQCTDDRPFNLLEDGESTHLRGKCNRGMLNTHLKVECQEERYTFARSYHCWTVTVQNSR